MCIFHLPPLDYTPREQRLSAVQFIPVALPPIVEGMALSYFSLTSTNALLYVQLFSHVETPLGISPAEHHLQTTKSQSVSENITH